ncbi:hypothetical protein [Labedaea rhizosphaerae]|uniref:NACHT domain-containing protein n=1 Tax=Labedaea rhizosphaerae TaxID=598644 RepID=A0A4R6SFY4_LABRH|nr:hypothetical protein [Labedaea rhizosphaerae]TDQ00544.1 hypothetical protein EV186_102405 [Labedaea rhizosphaerae]
MDGKVSNSGDATASYGGYANTGVHIGDINLITGAPVTTNYHQQVRRIAPPRLYGRAEELAELARFCTSPHCVGKYVWWRANAWSGKSALMSSFVLHPPAGVRIVSFFVTARLASQNDRAAFIDNVMEQLLALLGQSLPPFLTAYNQDSNLLGLLTEAAEVCRRRGESFVLLVDGLDEDRGAHSGHSIAGLLPADPPAGMRVIVAGRPNPPIPGDVGEHHPLRDHAIVRPLRPSPEAEALRHEMERDLQRLLDGTRTELDLLGLVAAAGGGLSAEDLAELTETSAWEVRNRLKTVSGRSFATTASRFLPNVAPDVYLLAHEELQVTALDMLGRTRLAGYRERLHAWFRRYRERGWPEDTPEYLLGGYFRMVTEAGDHAAMVACATDPARQDRMLDLSGGDAAAQTELSTCLDAIATQERPDLIALVRLAIHRDHLRSRNRNIPVRLPAVWALLGQVNRAVAMAGSITLETEQWHALLHVAAATAETGDLDWAETIASSISDSGWRSDALASVAWTAIVAGDRGRARRLVELADTDQDEARIRGGLLAAAAAVLGDHDRAIRLLAQAEDPWTNEPPPLPMDVVQAMARVHAALTAAGEQARADGLTSFAQQPDSELWALAAAAEAAAAAGDSAGALAHVAAAESGLPIDHSTNPYLVVMLAKAAADSGDFDRADALLGSVEELTLAEIDPDDSPEGLAIVPEIATIVGVKDRAAALVDQAEALVDAIEDSYYEHGEALAELARAAALAGDGIRASALAERSAAVARLAGKDGLDASVWASLARAAAATGDARAGVLLDRVVELEPTLDFAYDRIRTLGRAAKAAGLLGEVDRVSVLVDMLLAPGGDSDGLTGTALREACGVAAEALGMAGQLGRAAELLSAAEQLATAVEDPDLRLDAWRDLAESAAAGGLIDRAVAFADRAAALIPAFDEDVEWKRGRQVRSLASIARVAAAAGDAARASTLLDRAEELGTALCDTQWEEVMAGVAKAASAIDVHRAVRIAHTIYDPYDRAAALVEFAELLEPDLRTRALAEMLLLSDWHQPIRGLVTTVPAALSAVLDELDAVRLSGE